MNLTRSYVEIVEEHPKQYEEVKRKSPTRASPSKPQRASPVRASPQKVGEDTKDWSFVADNDVLFKELDLGKDLLQKASDKITPELLKQIVEAQNLTKED